MLQNCHSRSHTSVQASATEFVALSTSELVFKVLLVECKVHRMYMETTPRAFDIGADPLMGSLDNAIRARVPVARYSGGRLT